MTLPTAVRLALPVLRALLARARHGAPEGDRPILDAAADALDALQAALETDDA